MSSIAPSPTDTGTPGFRRNRVQAEMDAEVAEHLARVEGATIAQIGRLAKFGLLPLMAVISVEMVATGRFTAGFFGWLAGGAMLTVGSAVESFPHRWRRNLLAGGCAVLAFAATWHFGPNLGTGLIYAIALLAGTLFYGAGGAVRVAVFLMTGLVGAAVATSFGWISPEISPGSAVSWARLIGSTAVSLVGTGMLVHMVYQSFREAVRMEVEARWSQRQSADARERVLRNAQTAQRLEGLGRLAGGVAHDVNNALSVVQAGVEALQDGASGPDRDTILEDVRRGVDRASATTRQLLAFARRNPLARGEGHAPVTDVVHGLVSTLKRVLPDHVRIVADCPTAKSVALEPAALEQILLNLALNARDAMPEGGVITIRAEDRGEDRVSLRVHDTGCGMSTETLSHAFEPFFTTKGDKGTGLGLAMVWALVRQRGGEVTIDSRPGEGTTVKLNLPVAKPAVPEAKSPAATSPAKRQGRILVVEDQADVRGAMLRVLKRTGAEVVAVGRVDEVGPQLATGPFRLLITDGILADGTAAQVLALWRAQLGAAPVIVCSGHLPDDLDLDVQAEGARFVAKPFTAASVLAAVDELWPIAPRSG